MQNNNRYSKYVALVALLISIVGVTLGFAAYSNTVQIKASADVAAPGAQYPGQLSVDPDEQQDGTVTPTVDGATADQATLTDNEIRNIKVHFTAPDQSAEYAFYAVNPTTFTSYLNSVVFGTKSCSASLTDPNPATQYSDACEDINMRIFVDSNEYTASDTDIDGISIAGETSVPVLVIIEYIPGGRVADGAFDVDFGTSSITFSTVD